MNRKPRVLVIGIALADVENSADEIAQNFSGTHDWEVEQRWVIIGKNQSPGLSQHLAERLMVGEPKFVILNRMLEKARVKEYDFIIVSDDDIELPALFLDKYLKLVGTCDFALAQPARTHDSYIDHPFVEQLDGITARQTRFVEIGPLFSVRADLLPLLTPFSPDSPMGWGYDFTWPVVVEAANLKMGIIDAVPVAHKLRPPVANYRHAEACRQMQEYLAGRPHLEKVDAFRIVESIA